MRDVPEAVEVYDDNSEEEEQGVITCPWTEQAEAAELEAAANILHDFVDEDPIAEQPDDDHLDEQADANEEVPQILFDRVNPVAVEEIGKRVHRLSAASLQRNFTWNSTRACTKIWYMPVASSAASV